MTDDVEQIESEARQFGWVPKEQFRGNESDWVDAETFVERGKALNPILRANNQRLLDELNKTKKELGDVRGAVDEFKQIQKDLYERRAQEYERQIKELKQDRKTALKEGELETVANIEEQIEELEAEASTNKPPKEAPKQENNQPQIDPALEQWLTDNSWFGRKREETEIANAIGTTLRSEGYSGTAFLKELDNRLKKRLPELYGNQNQDRDLVEGSTTRSSSPSGKTTYGKLPPDAQAACDKFVKAALKIDSKKTEKEAIAEYISLYEG